VKIEAWNEWDPLESVIVGKIDQARVSQADESLRAIAFAGLKDTQKIPSGLYPQKVLEEAGEDLELLCETFRKLNIEVLRPEIFPTDLIHGNPFWKTDSQYFVCPRDSALIVGDMIIETPMPVRARFFETYAYRDIFMNAFEQGARWISAPKPRLLDENYSAETQKGVPTLNDVEICFDAANILRCGKDLFYLVSNSGNKKGATWLQSVLGKEFKVHALEGIYSYMHLDSTISFLRPGLVLLNPSRINKDNLPAPLKNWDIIWCPEPVDIGYHPPYENASIWIGMNLLMINPNLAVVEKNQTELIRALENKGIDVIPSQMRHQRTLGGGAHCVTLDLKRKGSLEKYF
jgi:glycine amidinotransferase/scyllo-inosamine-4-phosphate amidinotransferase 1